MPSGPLVISIILSANTCKLSIFSELADTDPNMPNENTRTVINDSILFSFPLIKNFLSQLFIF